VVLTSDDDIAALRMHVELNDNAWTRLLDEADAATERTYVPRQLPDHEDYFHYALPDAQDVRAMALVYLATASPRYLSKADAVLRAWARDALLGDTPGRNALVGQGLVIARVMLVFADAYALLEPELTQETKELVVRWLRVSAEQITASRDFWEHTTLLCSDSSCDHVSAPWINNQYSNHLSAQDAGLLAIGYALRDQSLIRGVLDPERTDRGLRDMLDGAILMTDSDAWPKDPTRTQGAPGVHPGEMWDRLRIGDGRGLHYAHIQLRFLTLQALMAQNNSDAVDWFRYRGPDGETLRLSFEFYAEFLTTGDSSVHGGYYSSSPVDMTLAPLYLIAAREYPESSMLSDVAAIGSQLFDPETFGWSLAATAWPSTGDDNRGLR
jgi:hypothetical protein